MGGQILDYELKQVYQAERANTERERKRADAAEANLAKAHAELNRLRKILEQNNKK